MADSEAIGWLVLDPPRDELPCGACGEVQALPPADVTCLLPTCTVFDAIFDSLGTVANEARPAADVLRMLRVLDSYCTRLMDGSPMRCEADLTDMLGHPAVRAFLDVCGCVQVGSTLHAPQRRGGHPCQRLVIAHTVLQREIGCIEGGTAVCATQPRSARLGAILTAFDKLQCRVESPRYFPLFDDLYEAVQIRNFFYLCAASASDVTAIEAWLDHFESARALAQDVLARVESFHRVMQCPRDVEDVVPRTAVLPRTPPPMGTPPRGASASSCLSPSELLTRTPLQSVDRDLIVAQRPRVVQDEFRDPATQPAGLFNVRQCCFVNALVQSLFRVEAFRSSVLNFPGEASSGDGHARIARRLQSLFGFMSLSQCAAINPGPLLDAIGEVHASFAGGGQHDAQELAGALFESLATAFDAHEASKENTGERMAAAAGAAEAVRRCTTFEVSSMLCSAQGDAEERRESPATLVPMYDCSWLRRPHHVDPLGSLSHRPPTAVHAALDDFFCAHVDAEGANIIGSVKAIRTPPRMLILYVATRTASRDHRCIDYPEWLSLEPFMEASTARLEWKERHHRLSQERSELLGQQGAIGGALKVAATHESTKDAASHLRDVAASLSCRLTSVEDDMRVISERLMSGLCPPAAKGSPTSYRLAAVVAHRRDGDGSVGHYWTCGRNGEKWEKLDDARTSEISRDQVLSPAVQADVYCVVYDQQAARDLGAEVPTKLRALIESEDHRRRKLVGTE